MPYKRQGIATAESCRKIKMSTFTKEKLLKGNNNKTCLFAWDNGDNISARIKVYVVLDCPEKYIRLKYSVTEGVTKKETKYDYKIRLIEKDSNLGVGKVYYFKCPSTGDLCRVLYMAYGSNVFKSRFAYFRRIYYDIQRVSKHQYATERYFKLKDTVDRMRLKGISDCYKGVETRRRKRYNSIIESMERYERIRLTVLSNAFTKLQKWIEI